MPHLLNSGYMQGFVWKLWNTIDNSFELRIISKQQNSFRNKWCFLGKAIKVLFEKQFWNIDVVCLVELTEALSIFCQKLTSNIQDEAANCPGRRPPQALGLQEGCFQGWSELELSPCIVLQRESTDAGTEGDIVNQATCADKQLFIFLLTNVPVRLLLYSYYIFDAISNFSKSSSPLPFACVSYAVFKTNFKVNDSCLA